MVYLKKPDGGLKAWLVVAASFMISFIQVQKKSSNAGINFVVGWDSLLIWSLPSKSDNIL